MRNVKRIHEKQVVFNGQFFTRNSLFFLEIIKYINYAYFYFIFLLILINVKIIFLLKLVFNVAKKIIIKSSLAKDKTQLIFANMIKRQLLIFGKVWLKKYMKGKKL